ncbi:tetratricopeptide repeat protein [Actinoplanes sp. NPDC051861]|uniref:tetratricopeptide repeat protein n=1 Tax=Actinoplanes sp. NPDC051861 TaxID=3155170 RepID=UPI00342D3C82
MGVDAFAALPDPASASSLDDLVERLRLLKTWAGDPSYENITGRVNARWTADGRESDLVGRTTVVDCFRPGRRRMNIDLVLAVVRALHPDPGYVADWRRALRMISGENRAAAQVRVQDTLPGDLPDFTAREDDLRRLREAGVQAYAAGRAPIIVITGMAGVGKSQLAVHAGHLLARTHDVDHVLFVNLRGFHEDPTKPPADASAVLEGFLRLLGVPSLRIPHQPGARAAAFRDCLTGRRALLVLDNAADEEQVRLLVPDLPGCLAVVTSRRRFPGLERATHLALDPFTPAEALRFLSQATPRAPLGHDPAAPARIARYCGYLPLALALLTGHIRATPGWTLTDHADRLDERRQERRLDNAVELALHQSYQHLADGRRTLRLLALHPGQDFDEYAAAALTDSDTETARSRLDDLCRDHLVRPTGTGRYAFHDLVRAFAVNRAGDEDAPSARRAALTRLFDYYLSSAATAMDTRSPAERHSRPRIAPAGLPMADLSDPGAAAAWLDAERPTLIAMAAYTTDNGWPVYTTDLSQTLFRYLNSGHHTDALTIHEHARRAARYTGDSLAHAHALTNLAATHTRMGQYEAAIELGSQAVDLFQQAGAPGGEARASNNLAIVQARLGRYRTAADLYERAMLLCREAGDPVGEPLALGNLGNLEARLGRHASSVTRHDRAVALLRALGDRHGVAASLNSLAEAEIPLGRHREAAEHLAEALAIFADLGERDGRAWTLDNLGTLHTHLGQADEAAAYHREALDLHRETGERDGEASALNGLGAAAYLAGDLAAAVVHYGGARAAADAIGDQFQQARASSGLGLAHHARGDHSHARGHYQQALSLYDHLGAAAAEQIRACLAALDARRPPA